MAKIMAERYAPDFLLWVSLTTRDLGYLNRLEARFMLTIPAKTNTRFYITASKAELTRRGGGGVGGEFLDEQQSDA